MPHCLLPEYGESECLFFKLFPDKVIVCIDMRDMW